MYALCAVAPACAADDPPLHCPTGVDTGRASTVRRRALSLAMEDADVAAMVIASPNATVNRSSRMQRNRCGTGVSLIPYQAVAAARLHPVHRDT
jgi:hypothetical protein